MRRITIELDGVEVEARLREDVAPKTCEAFWEGLAEAFVDEAVHAAWSGQVFHTTAPAPISDEVLKSFVHPLFPGVERVKGNLKCNICEGDIILYPPIKEVCIGYGEGQFRVGPAGAIYVTFLGQIDPKHPNYRAFMEKAAALQTEGAKRLVFRRSG